MRRLLPLFLLCGCAFLGQASDAVRDAQRELGQVQPKLDQLLKEYDAAANARITHCESLDLPTKEAARACLGVFDPASNLSLAVNRAREAYNDGATSLHDLVVAIELLELTLAKEKPSED